MFLMLKKKSKFNFLIKMNTFTNWDKIQIKIARVTRLLEILQNSDKHFH